MIAIDNVLVSDEVIEAKFVCDLHKCKGGCCEDGDAGAPLEKKEMQIIEENFKQIQPYLSPEGYDVIKNKGKFLYDKEFGWVTPTVNNAICAYGFRDKKGIIKCGIEAAYNDGKLDWKKPISCHLFPIKTTRTKDYTMVNYEPREGLCNPGCVLGKKVKMPVYQFLKESLIRKFGEAFYNTLHQIALDYFEARQGIKRK